MGHLLFPIVVLIIAVIRAFASAKSSSTGSPSVPPNPRPTVTPGTTNRGPGEPGETAAERQRRFMEAIGLPPDSSPPTPVRPRTSLNPPPLMPVNFPPGQIVTPGRLKRVPTTSAPPARQGSPQPAIRRVAPVAPGQDPAKVAAAAAQAAVVAAATAQAGQAAQAAAAQAYSASRASAVKAPVAPAVVPSSAASGLMERLRDPASIRQAIILREILGPPKALQSSAPLV